MTYMTERLMKIVSSIMGLMGMIFTAVAIKYWGATPESLISIGLIIIPVLLVWLIVEARKP